MKTLVISVLHSRSINYQIEQKYLDAMNDNGYGDQDRDFFLQILKMHFAEKIVCLAETLFDPNDVVLLSFVKEFKEKSDTYFDYEDVSEIKYVSDYCELVVNFHAFCQDFPELLYISEQLSDHNM